MTQDKIAAAASHWRRRTKSVPIASDQAARQGAIASLAFLSLGKDAALAFLSTELPILGGRPLAVATASEAVDAKVRTILADLTAVQADGVRPGPHTVRKTIASAGARDGPQ